MLKKTNRPPGVVPRQAAEKAFVWQMEQSDITPYPAANQEPDELTQGPELGLTRFRGYEGV
jgi:hypothetical protein